MVDRDIEGDLIGIKLVKRRCEGLRQETGTPRNDLDRRQDQQEIPDTLRDDEAWLNLRSHPYTSREVTCANGHSRNVIGLHRNQCRRRSILFTPGVNLNTCLLVVLVCMHL